MTPPAIAALSARRGAEISWDDAATLVVPPVVPPIDESETDGRAEEGFGVFAGCPCDPETIPLLSGGAVAMMALHTGVVLGAIDAVGAAPPLRSEA